MLDLSTATEFQFVLSDTQREEAQGKAEIWHRAIPPYGIRSVLAIHKNIYMVKLLNEYFNFQT